MKSMKQALALLLCFLMLFSTPINAFATGGVPVTLDSKINPTADFGTVAENCDQCTPVDGDHAINCPSRCNCGTTDNTHAATCPLYKCPSCVAYSNQVDHEDWCDTRCSCGDSKPENSHLESCELYRCPECETYINQGYAHYSFCPDFLCPFCNEPINQIGATDGCVCYYADLFNSTDSDMDTWEVYIGFLDKSKENIVLFDDAVSNYGNSIITLPTSNCPDYLIIGAQYYTTDGLIKFYDLESFDATFNDNPLSYYYHVEPKYFTTVVPAAGLYATISGSGTVKLLKDPYVNDDSVQVDISVLANKYTVADFKYEVGTPEEWFFKLTPNEDWPSEAAEYLWIPAKYVTLSQMPSASEPEDTTEQEVSKTLGSHTITVSGVLPDGVVLDAAELETDMSDYVHSELLGLNALNEHEVAFAYDISMQVGENKVQPDGTVTVKLDGLDTNKYTEFTVYHLPNTDAETIRKVMDGETIVLDAPETLTPVTVGDGYIEFETDGFSTYYILAGSLSDNSGNDTFYILRGTAVELTNVTSNNFTVTYPDGVTAENSGVTLARSGNTLTVTATSTAQYGTYTVKITDRRTATIIVLTPEEIFNIVANNDVYFTCVRNSTNVPSEPISGGNYSWTYITDINNGRYSFTNSWGGAFQSSPDGFLKLDVIANSDSLEQNLQGQNVIGVIDSGWGADTLPCINYTDEQWHELLKQFVEYTTVQISDGVGGTVTLTSSMVDEKLENGTYRYKMFPYVVKLILESSEYQKGWHVDCAVVDTKTYSVSYEYNLPSSAVLQESSDLIKPEMAFYSPGTDDVKVGVMTLDRNNVTGDTSVTVYDTNTQSTSEYKFLYWNTAPDGSGTSYSPDDTLPAITENVVLYAIWNHTRTSGTLKLQKREVFEDANDERKNDGKSYTFTITFANAEAGKSYPYTIYNADNTVKSAEKSLVSGGEIVLQADEYAVVKNVPGGSVTVSESVASDSEFDVSWNVAGSKTEGSAVTATVTAGNQAEIVCVNTYSLLVADLTITKNGWNPTDEYQSYIFTVTGPNGFEMDVVINGNGSVTIKDLPIGEYTVTENTDWSWRYTPDDNSHNIVLTVDGENTVNFKNNRSWIYWLSGDSYNENQFTVKTKDEE